MKITKLDIAVFSVLAIIVIFVGAPLLASFGPIQWIEDNTQPDIVDPSKSFDDITSVEEAALIGDFRTEDTYQTIYAQNINSCNTYTITKELELVTEGNGMSKVGSSTTLETHEPTAITCMVDASVVEGDEDKEMLLMILDYSSQNGEYTQVDSVEEIRDRRKSQGVGSIVSGFF